MEDTQEATDGSPGWALTRFVHMVDRLRLAAVHASGFHSRWVSSPLGPLHVLEASGDGPMPMLVLLHGLGGAAIDFERLLGEARTLARRVIVPELPGHGCNPDVPPVGLEEAEHAFHAVLDEIIGEGQATLFGNSLGGIVAIRYALARPERVAALLLASPGGARTTPEEHRALMERLRYDTLGRSRALVRHMFPEVSLRLPLAVGLRVRMARAGARRFLQAARFEQTFTPEELASLRMPILLTWGRREQVFPPSHLAFFRECLPPHAVVEEPEHEGHSGFVADPRGVARRLRAFWDAHVG